MDENDVVKSLSNDFCQEYFRKIDDIRSKTLNQTNMSISPNTCSQFIRNEAFKGNTLPLKNILVFWAQNDKFKLQRNGDFHYSYYETLGILIPAFAELEHLIALNGTEKAQIYEWMRGVLRAPLAPSFKDTGQQPRCNVLIGKHHFVDDCGSTRFRYTNTRLLGALLTGDQELFEIAKADTAYILSFFDDAGVHKGMAVRGGLALGYSSTVPYHMAQLAEIYATIDVDLYALELNEDGLTLADAIGAHFALWDDPSPLLRYAKYNKGNKGFDWTLLKSSEYKYDQKLQLVRPAPKESIAFHSIRYVEKYDQSLKKYVLAFKRNNQLLLGQWGSDVNAVYLANKKYSSADEEEWYSDSASVQLKEIPVVRELPKVSENGCTDPYFAALFPESCSSKDN